ncbi:MAG: hypothetical protein JO129_02045, partial [Candidatus Dependentiae bacterium]|nr:hypothetical protein [Candidatus Dependentiae bacterium]
MKNMYKNISLFLIIFMIMQLDYCAQAQQGNQEKEELMEFLLQQYNQQPDLEGIITLPTINKLLFLQNIIYLEKLLLKQPNPRENFINRLIEDGIRPLFRSIQVTNNAENTRFRLQKILQIIKLLQLEQKQEEQREQIQLISYNQEQIDLHLAQLIENFNQLAEEQVPQNNRMRQNTLQMLKHSILTMLKNINLREISKEVEAERLIRESYFSPEMQFTVLASVEKPFAINVVTGKVHDIPTVQNIIDAHAGNETLRMNALHAALEATRMALFAAGLDAAYGQTEYIFVAPTLSSEFSRTVSSTIGLQSSDFLMPQLDEDLIRLLHEKKQSIETELWQYFLTAAYVWSWIPTNLIKMFYLYSNTNPADVAAIRLEHINTYNFEDPRNIEIIPNNLLEQIIKNYDFKQKVQPDIAANLIFKQCFIMQQPTYDPFWKCIPKGEQITATNYIFDSFPDINMLCNEISQKVANRQINPQQARKKLFEVRKAIQTALYIANKKSTFYIGYVLPPAITQFLDGVTQKLITYDAKLRNLCKNPALGGTQADLQNDILWTQISIIAA